MDCILFRHGIARDIQEWDGAESKRPLTPHGVEKSAQAAKGLIAVEIEPTVLLSSPYIRALQTAECIREVLELPLIVKRCNDLLPDAPPYLLFDRLSALSSDACVICVGHEPHLSAAAGLMLGGVPIAGFAFKKAGACCIRFEGAVKPGEGILRWWLMPSQLRALGKD